MSGIYEDISYNKNRKLEKLRLFFDLPEHACDTMKYLPISVIDVYLKMHLKEDITLVEIRKLIKMDYEDTMNIYNGVSSNVMEYLSYYFDVNQLNGNLPRFSNDKNFRGKPKTELDLAVNETTNSIFKDTRYDKLFKLLET